MKDTATIAAGHRVIGTISAAEDLVIHGRVEGRIQSEATVIVEASAIIEADILANHVVVKGIVIGEVQAVEGIEVWSTAQIAGDLKTRRLTLRAGGRVSGLVASGVDVAGFSAGMKSSAKAATWTAPARAIEPSAAVISWPSDEVVETETRESSRASAKNRRKEPSREVS